MAKTACLASFMVRLRFVVLALLTLMFSSQAWSARHVLLIGVSNYKNDINGITGSASFPDLRGPIHDINSLQRIIEKRWQVSPGNLQVLTDQQATKAGILDALDSLISRTKAEDTAFIYFSGHGTSSKWVDKDTNRSYINMPDGTGALVPYEFSPVDEKGHLRDPDTLSRQMVIGRRDLKPRLLKLDKKGVHTWVVVDACYSGNAVRSAFAEDDGASRQISVGLLGQRATSATRSIASKSGQVYCENCNGRAETNGYPYDNVVFFGASSEGELAKDMAAHETFDELPHGALTESLLRVLDREPIASFTYSTLFKKVAKTMKRHCKCRQGPVLLPRRLSPKEAILGSTVLNAKPADENHTVPPEIDKPRPFTIHLSSNATRFRPVINGLRIVESKDDPTLRLRYQDRYLVATDTNGELIHRFPDTTREAEIKKWLSTRKWLHQRIVKDESSTGSLTMALRDGVTGNGAMGGTQVYFSVWLEKAAKLLVLDVFGNGEVAVLYPYYRSELARLPSKRQLIVPAVNGDTTNTEAIQGINVKKPFGTDTLLLYAFSGNSPKYEKLLASFRQLSEELGNNTTTRDHPLIAQLEAMLPSPEINATHFELVTMPPEL